jgi:hypothetical protein
MIKLLESKLPLQILIADIHCH